MRYSALLALGLGNLAFAQNDTNPDDGNNGSPGGGSPDASALSFPDQIGDFQFYGCTESEKNHPTFSLVASTDSMSLGFCAASCPSRFFGVYGTDCYCGDEIDDRDVSRVDNEQCNTPCPGDDDQACGGAVSSRRLGRRQSVPLSALLSTYIRVLEADEDKDKQMTDGPEPTTTITTTITVTGTITACPPDYPDCPIGQPTVSTITSEYCPEPTSHKKAIVCYGNHCVAKVPCHGGHCKQHRIVCRDGHCFPEECQQGDKHHNKLVVCHGDECHYEQCHGDECNKKIVCYGDECIQEKCYGEECSKKLICHGEECDYDECEGDDCHTEEDCEGDVCIPVPPCEGSECPKPPPPGPAPCHGPECPCEGPDCHATPFPTPTPGPCVGPDCPPCEGPHCPEKPPVAGSEKHLPAIGMGIVAGLAFLL